MLVTQLREISTTVRLIKSLLVAIICTILAVPVSASETIKVGVDPCTFPLMERLANAYARENDTYFQIAVGPCMSGVKKASEGEVDIGASTQNMTEPPEGCSKTVIAKALVALIVNKKNKVKDLSLDQMKGIFSGEITNWKEVGGKDLPIKLVMIQPCVMTAFSKQVSSYGDTIEKRKVVPFVRVNAVQDTNKLVEEDVATLGQTIYGYESYGVKVLSVGGYHPGKKTFPNKYTLYQDYNLVTLDEPSGKVKGFFDFILSPEGQEIVAELNHIPLRASR